MPSTPQALGASQYAITFLPKEVENHQIDIKFNGELVQGRYIHSMFACVKFETNFPVGIFPLILGAPFICSVLDLSKITVHKEGLDKVPVNSLVSFFIETHGTTLNEKQISILGKSCG